MDVEDRENVPTEEKEYEGTGKRRETMMCRYTVIGHT
jgi:hypothetical protein